MTIPKSKIKKILLFSAAALIGLSASAMSVQAQNPYAKPNQTDINITGDVISQTSDTFMLDYGEGLITTIEMDDWAGMTKQSG